MPTLLTDCIVLNARSPLTALDILIAKKVQAQVQLPLYANNAKKHKPQGMALSKSESDIILNRANVALARSQRLVASWLPDRSADELANAKSEEEIQREEDEIFTAVPET